MARSARRSIPRLAFTLVELLVVIAILAVLMALLLPAVQYVRESARRMQCLNNLHQIGLAMQAYLGEQNVFPMTNPTPGFAMGDGLCSSGFISWQTQILPYLEQNELYQAINFDVQFSSHCGPAAEYQAFLNAGHPNATAASRRVGSFLCPSDAHVPRSEMGTAQAAPSNYMGNAGWPPFATGIDGLRQTPAWHNGIIGLAGPTTMGMVWKQGGVREADVTDGLGYTIAVAERLVANVDGGTSDRRMLSYCGKGWTTRRTLEGYRKLCSGLSHYDFDYSRPMGHSWLSGWAFVGNTYLHVMPPNTTNCHTTGGEADGINMITAASRHGGHGAHVLLADGRAVFVPNSIDLALWWGLGSRDGGENLLRLD